MSLILDLFLLQSKYPECEKNDCARDLSSVNELEGLMVTTYYVGWWELPRPAPGYLKAMDVAMTNVWKNIVGKHEHQRKFL